MPDFLSKLISDAERRIRSGYYDIKELVNHRPISLKASIKSARNNAIIAEIKPISPALGPLRPGIDPVEAAVKLTKGGAVALSVLTEPDNFGGNLENLLRIRPQVKIPLIMKDIVIDDAQIEAARKTGADCILLMASVFSTHRVDSMVDLIEQAHKRELEVLLEAHTQDELDRAMKTKADILGVNNRNLATLETDLETTVHLMAAIRNRGDRIIITESGLETAEDIRRLKASMVDGFLIGSSIMLSQDLESKVREFALA